MTLMENAPVDRRGPDLVVEDRHVVVDSAEPFYALVMASDPATGNGAFLNVEVTTGVTRVPLPLHRPGVLVEVVDVATGDVRASTTLP